MSKRAVACWLEHSPERQETQEPYSHDFLKKYFSTVEQLQQARLSCSSQPPLLSPARTLAHAHTRIAHSLVIGALCWQVADLCSNPFFHLKGGSPRSLVMNLTTELKVMRELLRQWWQCLTPQEAMQLRIPSQAGTFLQFEFRRWIWEEQSLEHTPISLLSPSGFCESDSEVSVSPHLLHYRDLTGTLWIPVIF